MHIINSGKDCDLARALFLSDRRPKDFLVMSYTFVGKMQVALQDAAFRVVVLDESHYIKDPKVSAPQHRHII